MNAHDRMTQRLDAVLAVERPRWDLYGIDDKHVFEYVRRNITPEAIEGRGEFDSSDVNHLLEAANIRLAPYEREVASND